MLRVFVPLGRPRDRQYLNLITSDEDIQQLKNFVSDKVELCVSLDPPVAFDVLVSTKPSTELLAHENLKTLIVPTAGIREATQVLLNNFPGLAVQTCHFNAEPTAEMALALLLAAAKLLVPIDSEIRRGDWSSRYKVPSDSITLAGKRAGILGYGHIGSRIERALTALGMEVEIFRRHPEPGQYRNDDLLSHLPALAALILAVPGTPQTQGIIGHRELSLLPNGAIVVNIARGQVIDESALFEQLSRGRLRAGIDVWYQYPESEEEIASTLPSQLDYQSLSNVIMSPHRGGHSFDMQQVRLKQLASQLNELAREAQV